MDVGVADHLDALIRGDRPDQCGWQVGNCRADRCAEAVGVAAWQVKQPDEAGLAFNEGGDHRAWFLPTMRSPSVRLSTAQKSRVWLRSPCGVVAYWECSPGSSGCPGC